jgi:hypothetical protein
MIVGTGRHKNSPLRGAAKARWSSLTNKLISRGFTIDFSLRLNTVACLVRRISVKFRHKSRQR